MLRTILATLAVLLALARPAAAQSDAEWQQVVDAAKKEGKIVLYTATLGSLALKAVMQGETYLSPPISKQVVEGYVQRVGTEQPAADNLTPRQRQVLQLIAEGHSTKEIAYRLELSVKTVETHRAQLMDRLHIRDIAGLVKYAIRNGLVSAAK